MVRDFVPSRPGKKAPSAPEPPAPEVHEVGWEPVRQPDGRLLEHGLPFIQCSEVDRTGKPCKECDERAHRMVIEHHLESFRPPR